MLVLVQGASYRMATRDPAFIAQKWASNLGGATESIKAGVLAVVESPTEAAAKQADFWAQQVAASKAKFQSGLRRVSLGSWQDSTINKGLPRVASGAQQAIPKMQSFMTEFLPHVERVAQQVRAMPKGGLENGIARASAQIRGNAQFRRSGG